MAHRALNYRQQSGKCNYTQTHTHIRKYVCISGINSGNASGVKPEATFRAEVKENCSSSSSSGGKYVKNVSRKPLIKFTGHIPEMPQATTNKHMHKHAKYTTQTHIHFWLALCGIEIYPSIRLRACVRVCFYMWFERFPLKRRKLRHHFVVLLL